MEVFRQVWPYVYELLHLLALFGGVAAIGLFVKRRNDMTGGDMNGTYQPDLEELRRRRKQKQGGHIFNEMLRGMRERNNRTMGNLVDRLTKPDIPESERILCAEMISVCRNEINDIDHLLEMKEPE